MNKIESSRDCKRRPVSRDKNVQIGRFPGKYASQFGSGTQYAYYHDEDESTFHLVDTTRVQKPPYQRGRFRMNQRNMRGGRGGRNNTMGGGMQSLGKGIKARDAYKKNQVRKFGQGRVRVNILINCFLFVS